MPPLSLDRYWLGAAHEEQAILGDMSRFRARLEEIGTGRAPDPADIGQPDWRAWHIHLYACEAGCRRGRRCPTGEGLLQAAQAAAPLPTQAGYVSRPSIAPLSWGEGATLGKNGTFSYAPTSGDDKPTPLARLDREGSTARDCARSLKDMSFWLGAEHEAQAITVDIALVARPEPPVPAPLVAACERARLFLATIEDLPLPEARQASELQHRLRSPSLGVLKEAVLLLGGVHPARLGQAALVADLLRLVGPAAHLREQAAARDRQNQATLVGDRPLTPDELRAMRGKP